MLKYFQIYLKLKSPLISNLLGIGSSRLLAQDGKSAVPGNTILPHVNAFTQSSRKDQSVGNIPALA